MPSKNNRKGDLIALYHKKFGKKIKAHHLVPRTRKGPADEFNLFPFNKERERAWHDMFSNMTIFEVFFQLDEIHESFFLNGEKIKMSWLKDCELPSVQKKALLNKRVAVDYLIQKWELCFHCRDLKDAKNFINYMMFFMIFGGFRMLEPKSLSNDFFLLRAVRCKIHMFRKDRRMAFAVCFGKNPEISKMEEKISKVIKEVKDLL